MYPSQTLTPNVQNLTLTTANTEYSVALPANCKGFSIQCRTAADIRFAFVTGKVAASTAPFMTLKSGQSWNSPEKMSILEANKTIYFAGGSDGLIVEVLAWS